MKSHTMKWHGGKSYLASWIIGLMPPHTHYLEPFFGAGAVLFSRDGVGISETINDLDGELMNFWSVLASPKLFKRFKRRIDCTPLSQSAWENSHRSAGTKVGRAFRFFVRFRQSRQGLGKNYVTPTRRTRRGMNEQCSAWLTAVDGLLETHNRLRRVEIRNLDAIKFLQQYDHANALVYLDPPYPKSTRTAKDVYQFEMTDTDHIQLLEALTLLKSKFMISTYPNPIYKQWGMRHGFNLHSRNIDNKASSKKTKGIKTELLYCNF